MNNDNDREYFRAIFKDTSAKAYLVELVTSKRVMWVPHSISEWHGETPLMGMSEPGTLMIESWFCKKNDL